MCDKIPPQTQGRRPGATLSDVGCRPRQEASVKLASFFATQDPQTSQQNAASLPATGGKTSLPSFISHPPPLNLFAEVSEFFSCILSSESSESFSCILYTESSEFWTAAALARMVDT